MMCDSVLCQFQVPKDKLLTLEAITREALDMGLTTFAMLEKLRW